MAGEISLERQNLAVYAEDDENVLFSSVLLPGDLRSNYFCYQSRSVRWLYKKLQWQNGKKKENEVMTNGGKEGEGECAAA